MSKKNYFKILRDELKRRNVKNIEDIIDDYDDLIHQKMKEGVSEDEAIRSLGPVEELANSYGTVQTKQGEVNYSKFLLLQIFNLFIGLVAICLILSVVVFSFAVIIASVVVGFGGIFAVIVGSFTSFATVLLAIAAIVFAIFLIGLSVLSIKVCFLIIYNYVIYNINTIKRDKILYKRVRVGKFIILVTAISFILTIAFVASGTIVDRDNWRTNTGHVLNELSYNSGDYIEILDKNVEKEFSDDITNLDVKGVYVVFEVGKENKVEANYEFEIKKEGNTLIVDGDRDGNGFQIGVNFLSGSPKMTITLKEEMDSIDIKAVNLEIDDVIANNYNINTVNAEIDIYGNNKASMETFEIKAVNLDIEIDEVEVDKMKIKSVNLDMNVIDSEIDKLYISDCVNVDIELESSIIEKLYGSKFLSDIKWDEDSDVDKVEE